MRGSSSSPYLFGILHVDAEALHEALVAQVVDGRLVGGEVEEHDRGVRGLVAQRPLRPTRRSAYRPCGCRWRRSRRPHPSDRAACRARSPSGRRRAPSGWSARSPWSRSARWRSPWRPPRSGSRCSATWPSLSPSNLPAQAISVRCPSSLAFASAPSRILTKNGLVSVLVIRPTMSAASAEVPANALSARPATAAFRNFRFLMISSRWNTWNPVARHPGKSAATLLLPVVRRLEGNTSQ